MQIRLGLLKGSWPDRRRLQAQVRPGVEKEIETGGQPVAAVPGSGWPPGAGLACSLWN